MTLKEPEHKLHAKTPVAQDVWLAQISSGGNKRKGLILQSNFIHAALSDICRADRGADNAGARSPTTYVSFSFKFSVVFDF